ncbi:Protein-tyrosine phosphatase, low molecular weight like protein [Aduncisulcus paluster]|uniref:Protein-tyrosine phosphatase, low molecular weight like protein n=1 Tax=Aduncisulcus paluster TaxID=2918883 RepID=A0ABQ5KVQ7_9EUKA|nr:Protein-tyrosine phosphatase, low molecular weight like protein [Aduncisulcus paluster]
MTGKFRVLMVCTGNICRSPTADAILRHLIKENRLTSSLEVDSAGIENYHSGDEPDDRSIEHARKRGYDLTPLRARKCKLSDFSDFDLILAMDRSHYRSLMYKKPKKCRAEVKMFLEFSSKYSGDVSDPYYGGSKGFEKVLDQCEDGCAGIIEYFKKL